MNVYDSEQILQRLQTIGYRQCDSPDKADLIVLNTCAIREKAEQKVYSFLGRQAKRKQHRPELLVAVGGCVAQQEGRRLLERVPHLDLVFGTHAVGRLAGHVERIRKNGERIVDVDMDGGSAVFDGLEPLEAPAGPSRFVTVMQGCDNFCTYCVVPYVRGREASRPPSQILSEIRALVGSGVREVTLLGQNVNSYGAKEGYGSFAELLKKVSGIDGLARIRFTTSHPKDLSDELIDCFAALDRLCRHIHLPVQSGSDRVLKRMNRRYRRVDYLDRVGRLRSVCPDIGITSDFIVGFPGESEEDFADTIDLMRSVQFDGVFAFCYSDRPSAPASGFAGKIEETVKKRRLAELLDLQETITLRKNRALIGSVQQVMAEGPSKKNYFQEAHRTALWTGRTPQNRIVHFALDTPTPDGGMMAPGTMLNVRIEEAFSHSLRGTPELERPNQHGRKGVDSHAA